MIEYSFIAFRTDKPFYFSFEKAQDTLLELMPMLEKVHQDIHSPVDISVTVKVKSSSDVIFQTSGRPIPVKWQIWEHYVHQAGTTLGRVDIHSMTTDEVRRVLNRILEVFVSQKKASSMPFLQVDENSFPDVYKKYIDKAI